MIDNYNFEPSRKTRLAKKPRPVAVVDVRLLHSIRLNSGWSFHTGRTPTRSTSAAPSNRFGSAASAAARATTTNGNQVLRDDELERIKKVLERAQRIENTEQERVGYECNRVRYRS